MRPLLLDLFCCEGGAAMGPVCQHRRGRTMSITGNGASSGNRKTLGRNVTVDEWREGMGMSWASRHGLSEAIPPAYTEHIGRQLVDQVTR